MGDFAHVKGLAELSKFFDELPQKLLRNVLRGSLRAGAGAILPVARANIHNRTGELAKSLKTGSRIVGDKAIGRLYTRNPKAHLVEYGTKPHVITAKNRKGLAVGGLFFQSVHHPGARPRAFLRPAADTQMQAALVATAEYMKARFTKAGLDTADITVQGDDQ